MVTIDIKQLLRNERQRRTGPKLVATQQAPDEVAECNLDGPIILADFAVGADKLQVGVTQARRCVLGTVSAPCVEGVPGIAHR